MEGNMTWEEFCNLYYDTAKDYARIALAKQKKLLGELDRHVDEDYVVDETVLSSLEKTYSTYTSSRGARVTTLLSRIVHNQLIDILETENKRGARKNDLENIERTLGEFLQAEALEIPRVDLVAKLMEAVSRLSPSDQVIIECYLHDRKTFVAEASGILDISENYVSVRKNRILSQLRTLMGTTLAEYNSWKAAETVSEPVHASMHSYTLSDVSVSYNRMFREDNIKPAHPANPINPSLSVAWIAEAILQQLG